MIEKEPYLKEESDRIIGCAMRVHNEVGHGFHEKPYENALVIEFEDQDILNFKHKKLQWKRVVL